jgi:hypothetical protein
MRYFLYKLFCFVLIPIIILLLIEITIILQKSDILSEEKLSRKFANVSNDYKWIDKVKPGKKILLLGSSSVRYGLSCSQLNKLANDSISFINLAMDARNPIGTYFILKQLDLTDVKAVYFGLDPWIFAKNYYKYTDTYLLLDMDFITFLKYAKENGTSLIAKRYQEIFKYLYLCLNVNYQYKTNIYEIPPDFGSVKLEGKPKNFDNPVHEYFEIEKFDWSELQFVYLSKILNLCKDKNINFFVFLPPKRSDFSEDYKLNCKIVHEDFLNNLNKINFVAPVIGKFDQLDALGDSTLFAEPFHLNSLGQDVYTDIFFKMINDKIVHKINNQYSWFNDDNNGLKTK